MKTVGVPAEHKNIFERRTAVVPEVAGRLVKQGIPVLVERSAKRVFSEQQYLNHGARVVDNLDDAALVVGVKEPPVEQVANKIYMIFSHTIKGQPYNMPLLQRFLDVGATLIDYEMIKDANGRRLVAFGRFAGIAGMNDALWTLGVKLRTRGIPSVLDAFRPAHTFRDLTELFAFWTRQGAVLQEQGLPTGPLVVGITGHGRVGKGSEEVLSALGGYRISPDELGEISGKGLFYTVFEERHMFRRKRDDGFDLQEYYDKPELYQSIFEQYLPFLTIMMNSIYWEPRYPRLVKTSFIRQAYGNPGFRLMVIGDTTCDPMGACEITAHCTGPESPAYTYLPDQDAFAQAVIGDGITVFAVDNLPAELPVDSSRHFSETLESFIEAVVMADFDKSIEELRLPAALKRAVIVLNGKLTPKYAYLRDFLGDH